MAPRSLSRPLSSARRGVTLVEIAIVIAIFGIMAMMASQSMVGMVPSWRTKRAAKEFMVHLQQARDLAIAEGVEYRIRVDTFDTDLADGEDNIGSYYIERGDASVNSTSWDILPMDEDGVSNDTEGYILFSRGEPNALPWVSFVEPEVTTIIFDSRGFLTNSAADFGDEGMIDFKFCNKRALAVDGLNEWWMVSVSRAGFSRMSGAFSASIGAIPGTAGTTDFGTSSGSGYTGGSTGSTE